MGTESIRICCKQEHKRGISTEPGWPKFECNSDEESTFENDVADLDDYSLFAQGISNRPECYDLDQRHEIGKIADTCVKHTLSYQSGIDNSLTDDSDLYWKRDGHYSISPRDSALIKLDLPLTKNEKSLVDEFCKELKDIVAKGYRDKHENFTNTDLERIECITNKYL